MIVTSRLLDYPLLAIAPDTQEKIGKACSDLKVEPNVIAYLNSYLHVVGMYLDERTISSLEDIDVVLQGLEGFLLANTKLTEDAVAKIRNKSKRLLAATIGIEWTRENRGIKNTLHSRQQKSVDFYDNIKKSVSIVKYYSGWWVECREGKIKFVNLIDIYISYGEHFTNQALDLIQSHFIKFSHNSCATKLVHLKRIFNLMCILYPRRENLLSLQDGIKVNEFVELLFAKHKSYTISNNFNLKSFYDVWPLTIGLFKDVLTETAIMSAPEWPLLCPTYVSASEHDVKEEQTVFEKAFIDIPLTFSDEKAFSAFEAAVNDELSLVEKCCLNACKAEMSSYHEKNEKAKTGKVITNFRGLKFGNDFTEHDILRTWQTYTYNIAKTGIFSAITRRDFMKFVKPLRAHTMLPFMHLLVQHHPIITPPWLIEFELFDSSGQQVNYTQSGDDWIATGFKPRAKGHEQQSIVLTKTSKRIFDEIISITTDARDYLRSIGDDSHRRLFLSGGRGLQKPIPIETITPVGRLDSDIPLRYLMLSEISETFPSERVRRIIARLSLRTLRDAVAIQVFLRTMSMEAVAIALGHAPGNSKAGEGYIPSVLRFFMMEHWLRIFQNAIVYEAMKDSPHLLHAMDFNTLGELNDFLLTHKEHYKIVPDSETTVYQPINGLEDFQHDRLYIELNLAKLEILLCIYEIISTALKTGIEIVTSAMRWYRVATILYQAVHLHKEGTLASYCSRSVLLLFSKANPSATLMDKIKDILHA